MPCGLPQSASLDNNQRSCACQVIWKEKVKLVVGAASSRDHLISRLEAAPTMDIDKHNLF
jgi:hypothetical protein